MQNKAIDLDDKRSGLRKNFEKTKLYLRSQSRTEMLGKVGTSVARVAIQ